MTGGTVYCIRVMHMLVEGRHVLIMMLLLMYNFYLALNCTYNILVCVVTLKIHTLFVCSALVTKTVKCGMP